MNTSKILTAFGFFTAWILIIGIFLNLFMFVNHQKTGLNDITGNSVFNAVEESNINLVNSEDDGKYSQNLSNLYENYSKLSDTNNSNNTKIQSNFSNKENKNLSTNDKNKIKNSFTLSEVSKHNSVNNCWLIINNEVYDVTKYISSHPGGSSILSGCGKDATSMFNDVGHSNYASSLLEKYYIGKLISEEIIPEEVNKNLTNSDLASNVQNKNSLKKYNLSEISIHNIPSDCWLIIDKKVYDVSSYIFSHPAGASPIVANCGKDGSGLFSNIGHSSYAYSLLTSYYLGDVKEIVSNPKSNSSNSGSSNKEDKKDNKDKKEENEKSYEEDNEDNDDSYEDKLTVSKDNKIEDNKENENKEYKKYENKEEKDDKKDEDKDDKRDEDEDDEDKEDEDD